jgi:hypothetical protein
VRALVAGWFSLDFFGATAGDLEAAGLACDWLDEAGLAWDIALGRPFEGGVSWSEVPPASYSHVLLVCGPVSPGMPVLEILDRFPRARRVGLNLSVPEPPTAWNPFDLLLQRDDPEFARPDLAFAATVETVPLVGRVLLFPHAVDPLIDSAHRAIHRLLDARPAAVVPIDTRVDANSTPLRTADEIEAAVGAMDVVVTTRLHGLVLSLKRGVPVVAVDPVAGGGKISRQAASVGWPVVLRADVMTDTALERALDRCLGGELETEVASCALRGAQAAEDVRRQFVDGLAGP